jgi:transcriptional regulator with XRE-family HTH domain
VATAGDPDERAGGPVGGAVGQAVDDIGAYIRAQREHAKVSLRQLARTAGVSNPYLSQIERGLRTPSAEILQQIARGLRISAEALYVRAGILEERPAGAVTDAILADAHLTERQKNVLLEVYQSFRRENTGADLSE